MSKSEAGRLGARARLRLYGNPGTPEGRFKGGINSLATHKRKKTGFILQKEVKLPRPSVSLAEFIGIMLGDGHVGMYQASITTNSKTDRQHAIYVRSLIKTLFGIESTFSFRTTTNACSVVISSRAVCDFLQKNGLPRGNKVRDGVRIPIWIKENLEYTRHCVRGLFDTDGSVYVDRHVINEREYKNIGLAFANRSIDILTFFKDSLSRMGLHPTQKTPFTIFLRRAKEIAIFFKIISSSNPKHLVRYQRFRRAVTNGQGGVG